VEARQLGGERGQFVEMGRKQRAAAIGRVQMLPRACAWRRGRCSGAIREPWLKSLDASHGYYAKANLDAARPQVSEGPVVNTSKPCVLHAGRAGI
jgi:hypothetical protein